MKVILVIDIGSSSIRCSPYVFGGMKVSPVDRYGISYATSKQRKSVVFVTFMALIRRSFVTLIAFEKKLPLGTWPSEVKCATLNLRHTSRFLLYVGV